jgi:hypothetical protein
VGEADPFETDLRSLGEVVEGEVENVLFATLPEGTVGSSE